MTRTHEIKLDGYGAHTTLADDRPVMLLGTAESYGIEMLHIVPGKDWAELTITATFNAADGTSTDVLIGTDGNIAVPTEATAKSGSGRIVFTGVSNGIQRISCDLDYFVVAHSAINGAQSGGTAPSWFEQAVTRFMPPGGTAGQVLTKLTNTDFDARWQNSQGGGGGGGTTDHSQLINRDIADQHPISAITGLEEALTPLTGTTETLTPTQVYDAIKSGKSVVLQHTNSFYGLFTFASFNIFEGIKVVVSTSIVKDGNGYLVGSLVGSAGSNEWVFNITKMAEADDIPVAVNEALAQAKASGEFDGKSAYAYAQDGGYTGTEAEFAAKLAKEKFANPYALTFTGAVNEAYDGSSAKTIEIPGGGTGGCYLTVETITIGEGPGKTVKVNLATLELTNGITHKNGTLNTGITDGYTVEIPYIDGMRISTGVNPFWIVNYPPFIVLDNGSYTVPEYTTGDSFLLPNATPNEYTCVLSGYSTSAKVYVNLYAGKASMAQIEATDKYWYSYEN